MLLNYLRDLWYCLPVLVLILFLCVRRAYRVNARRSIGDPNKRDFHVGAVILALFSWPAILIGYVGLILLSAIVFAVSLVVVTLGLVFMKKPTLLPWLDKMSIKLGNILLDLNTGLIRAFLGKDSKKPPL